MNNKAQVSFEYFTIIALLLLFAAVVLIYSASMFSNKEGVKTMATLYKDKLLNMTG